MRSAHDSSPSLTPLAARSSCAARTRALALGLAPPDLDRIQIRRGDELLGARNDLVDGPVLVRELEVEILADLVARA